MPLPNLGAIERPHDDRDFQLGAIQAPVSIPDTLAIDLSWLIPPYQGETPTCGAHAAANFQAILEHANGSATAPRYTPRYLWIKIKQIDGFPLDAGTDMRSIFKALQSAGADDFEPLENDVTLPLPAYSNPTSITPDMDANAAGKKVVSYAFVDGDVSPDFDSLRQAIYQKKAVLLLLKCDNGFWGTATPKFTDPKYGHFVVAYDFTPDSIKIVDSADKNFPLKKIAKQYITPTFMKEAGTALDIPPQVVQHMIQTASNVTHEIVAAPISAPQKSNLLTLIAQALQSLLAIFSQTKVGSTPQPMTFLTGKKTYIIASLGIVYAVAGFFTGHLDSYSAIDVIFASLAAMGLRNGITTEIQSLSKIVPDKTLPPQ